MQRIGVRPQPLIAVRDVRASSRWYSKLLGLQHLGEHVNPAPQHREMWLRDPDGYVVVYQIKDWGDQNAVLESGGAAPALLARRASDAPVAGRPPGNPALGTAPGVGIPLAGEADPMPRFLVVDDDPAAVASVSTLLVDDGHTVAPFTRGAEAVDALAQESFDAVFTDLEMPHVDGHAVVRAAREHQPHACLVVATAKGPEGWADLVKAGACIVADKPFDYETVTTEVTSCRARGGPGASGRCHMRSRPDGHQLVPVSRK